VSALRGVPLLCVVLEGGGWGVVGWGGGGGGGGGGGPSTGPTLLFGAAGVSPCQCEPLRAGCCGGEGVLGVS